MFVTHTPAILPNDFYVYEHRRASSGEVFYVGKGQGLRGWSHQNRSRHWRNIAAKHGVTVAVLQDGLLEWAAHELERDLIALHGRRDLGLGPLVNLTDGGEGASGRVMPGHQRLALSLTKRQPEAVARNVAFHSGRKRSHETIAKMSAAKLGKPASAAAKAARVSAMNRPEVKAKLVAAQLGRVTAAQLVAGGARPVRCIETGEVFPSLGRATAACRAQGRPTSPGSIARSCATAGAKKAGGYTWTQA
jgi:hypothetical protein